MNSVLVDTSFLITLSNTQRPRHETAKQYFKTCIENQTLIYLSTIVISEFQVKQSINDLPLRNFIILPFNINHAMRCGHILNGLSREQGDDRVRIKDDLKLIAQCDSENITHLLTEDVTTLAKYIDRANKINICNTRGVTLANGFDRSWFNDGQLGLPE